MHSRCVKHMQCQCLWCHAQVLVTVTPGVLQKRKEKYCIEQSKFINKLNYPIPCSKQHFNMKANLPQRFGFKLELKVWNWKRWKRETENKKKKNEKWTPAPGPKQSPQPKLTSCVARPTFSRERAATSPCALWPMAPLVSVTSRSGPSVRDELELPVWVATIARDARRWTRNSWDCHTPPCFKPHPHLP
jgi:hypothetical protein